ncbi:hypothetical protein LLH03_17070 [bacterium]|nr:hypothetical protein [bacterium]
MRRVCAILFALAVFAGVAAAEHGTILGTVTDVRSGLNVPVHPVVLASGREVLARTITDRIGKFKLEFNYTKGAQLIIKTTATSGYLEAQGAVDPETEVAIKVMPRWATVMGIVTDKQTGRGMADIPVQAGRGEKVLGEGWAKTKTDATGIYMLKVEAFEGDDVTKPVRDLWLSINEADGSNEDYAAIQTDVIPLWAWQDATAPTKVEIVLPGAKATGFTLADLVKVKAPEPVAATTAPKPAATTEAPATTPAATPAPAAAPAAAPTAPAAAPAPTAQPGLIVCPYCGKPIKIIVEPGQ